MKDEHDNHGSAAGSNERNVLPSGVTLERRDDGVAVITFDRPGSSANLLDASVFGELGRLLDSLYASSGIRGLIFATAKPSIFIAGADLRALSENVSASDIEKLVDLGQRTFQRIADFPVPTVAAIHGACAGGGCELALACDWRVASDASSTRIGLPETQLGLVPAWGGCTRLTRLLGPAQAADLILKGKLLPARQAKKRGLVDAVCAPENLLDLAVRKAVPGENRPGRSVMGLLRRLQAPVVRPLAERKLKTTAEHYPAPGLALKVITEGALRPTRQSLRLEKEAIVQAASTDVCKNLIRLFFLREKASRKTGKARLPERMAVIGAGVMGAGLAQWFSSRGSRVILNDIAPEPLDRGMRAVRRLYRQGVAKRALTEHDARRGLDRISPADGPVPLPRLDLVIEAAAEKMEVKRKIFQELEEGASDNAILATNTSALSISEIASVCRKPERVIGMHFFNPVHRMPLVEIIPGDKTDPEITGAALDLARSAGKIPVAVGDKPGFLVNRILMPYLVESTLLWEEGFRVRDIDDAMTAFGMPMGPLRLLDEVGIDVAGHVAKTLADAYPERMQIPDVLNTLIQEKNFGKKSGRGFFHYGGRKPEPNQELEDRQTVTREDGPAGEDLAERPILALINEAAFCLHDGIAAGPEDVDLAMVLGTGFAPFRGGPLRHADSIGPARIVERLRALEKKAGARFKPCPLLLEKAEKNEGFHSR